MINISDVREMAKHHLMHLVLLTVVVSFANAEESFQYINFRGKDIVGTPPTVK